MNEKRKLILTYLLALVALSFILLTVSIVYLPLPTVDKSFSHAIQSYQSQSLDPIMRFISLIGVMPYSLIMVLLTALLFFLFKLKREAIFTLSTLLAGVASTIVKIIVDRPRPAAPFVHVLEKTVQQSFPSGHVNFYVVFFGFLIVMMYHVKTIPFILRALVITICALLIFFIPISRVYQGAHWFTDVIGGSLLGVLLLSANSYFYLGLARISDKSA
ncbi:phosphatase PAP2 family protein [Pedobacter caeni]|uniref:Undecaprenyl-diphosphatase n=1 Tax=Pedobacter caeni TaxID=288992 RepID=A0A1M5HYC2_9SPHI|nr:phosphatase PAP2 family protein [Pedobacter caeni]SHG20958.1 undecaprenyl-diphosphatase [Pedobacter caeni]